MRSLLLAAAAIAMIPSGASAATTIVNGSFESGTNPGSFTTVFAGDDTTIEGWKVTEGSVDYIGGYWNAQDPSRSIDLSGNGGGTIAQSFETVAGQAYAISFWLAGNPDGPPDIKDVEVLASGGMPSIFSFDKTGATKTMMGWKQFTYNFKASGTTATLSFKSFGSSPYGPALDNVSVAAVPEPATWAMMLLGFGLIGGIMRRRGKTGFSGRLLRA